MTLMIVFGAASTSYCHHGTTTPTVGSHVAPVSPCHRGDDLVRLTASITAWYGFGAWCLGCTGSLPHIALAVCGLAEDFGALALLLYFAVHT